MFGGFLLNVMTIGNVESGHRIAFNAVYDPERPIRTAVPIKGLILAVLVLCMAVGLQSQTRVVSGTVRDSVTGDPLVAATIRVLGSTRGTISNAQGDYRLSLSEGEYVLVFSYVGYKTDSVRIRLESDSLQDVKLEPSPVQLAEVVVTGEDPAMAIMRKVIEHKKRWIERLKSYQLEAFTRQTLRRDTSIAVITESYSTCYWQQGDTLREVIRQKRQTENVKGTQNFAGVGGILNFYDDEIGLSGFKFVGPTSPNAFDYYDFKLERTRRRTGSDIYDIKMMPKTRLVPLFRGTISIAEGSFAVAGISVSPNEAFAIPFVSELRLSYAQQFSLFEKEYWMPVDIRINGFFQIGLTGLKLPGIGIESISSIYDCKVNPIIPDSIFRRSARVVLKQAERYDSTFWAQRDVLPLTDEEKIAYHRLDSTQTLEKQFQPSGPLVTLTDMFAESEVSPNLKFNRVEGLFLGVSSTLDSLTDKLKTHAEVGYGFSDNKGKTRLGVEVFLDDHRTYSVGVEAYNDIAHFLSGNEYTDGENIFPTRLYKIDYFDYYYTKGVNLAFTSKPLEELSVSFGFRNEDQTNAFRRTNYSLFARDRTFESNPTIDVGTLREIWLKTLYGQGPLSIPIIPRDYVQVDIEHSTPGLGSSYDFTHINLQGEYHIATYLRSLFLPPSLMVKFSSGTAFGTLPTQRYYYFDSPLIGYAPSGVLRGAKIKEFSGDTYFLMTVEHNFRSVPFLWLNIPFLYKNSIELLLYANIAQSWNNSDIATSSIHPTGGVYTEIGCGISRILGLLRLDFTYRLTRPERWIFTMGVAMLL